MPRALDAVLRLIPLAVLSVGLVYAVNGAGYLIRRTDPFVGFFRRSAPLPIVLTGMAVPAGRLGGRAALLPLLLSLRRVAGGCARLAWKPVDVTGNECINCRLCVGTCPVDAITVPRAALSDAARVKQLRRFVAMLALGAGADRWLCGRGVAVGRVHRKGAPGRVAGQPLGFGVGGGRGPLSRKSRRSGARVRAASGPRSRRRT